MGWDFLGRSDQQGMWRLKPEQSTHPSLSPTAEGAGQILPGLSAGPTARQSSSLRPTEAQSGKWRHQQTPGVHSEQKHMPSLLLHLEWKGSPRRKGSVLDQWVEDVERQILTLV